MRAAAKINLGLGVGRVRPDGYHPLATVYQAIGLYDDVTVTDARRWSITLTAAVGIHAAAVPLDDDNIALRAGRLLAHHHGLDRCAHLHIDKGIPVAGGLAGGSADAAATLLALDRHWHLNTPDAVLLDLAARLGSDVPFALLGGTAQGSGRGEIVAPVTDTGAWWWVVVPHRDGLPTPSVYAEFDRLDLGDTDAPEDTERLPALLAALRDGTPAALAAVLHNDLEPAAVSLRPDLERMRAALGRCGSRAVLLSGSGPTWLGLADDADHARVIAAALIEDGYPCWIAPAPVAGAHVIVHEVLDE